MQAGRLDRRIDLQRQEPSLDGAGAKVKTWQTFAASIPARVRPTQGREQVLEGERQARTDREFEIRFRTDVTPKVRILYQERAFDVLDVQEIGRRAGLLIQAKARAE